MNRYFRGQSLVAFIVGAMEKEKMELEHRHQLELKQKEMENQLGANLTNTLITEAMKMPEVRQQFAQGVRSSGKKHK